MNEFVSNVFLISLENIKSNYGSNCLFTFIDNSFTAITAFLLRVDLKLSVRRIKSGMIAFVALETSISE